MERVIIITKIKSVHRKNKLIKNEWKGGENVQLYEIFLFLILPLTDIFIVIAILTIKEKKEWYNTVEEKFSKDIEFCMM